ncbi:MAG: hypothetical protein ACPKPY_14225 [Nitrososphaeraceae archaeon]
MSNKIENFKKVAKLKEHHKTQELIIDLKEKIDQFARVNETLREHILELARILDEEKLCKRDEVCRSIKDILDEKIKERKITAKWIEECLPVEYKRKYERKSELDSLLSDDGTKEIVLTTDGKTEFQNNTEYNNNSGKIRYDNSKVDLLNISKEDLKSNKIQDADDVLNSNNILQQNDNPVIEFNIPKNRHEELAIAMKLCQNHIIVRLNGQNKIISIESDVGMNDDNDTKHDGDIHE